MTQNGSLSLDAPSKRAGIGTVMRDDRGSVMDRSPSWGIYMQIRDLLHANPLLEIRKIGRNNNQVAHCLAELGNRELSGVLSDSAPSCVLELIANDCKHFMI
jgi:hypothetical protein